MVYCPIKTDKKTGDGMYTIDAKLNDILSTVVTFYRNQYGDLLEQVWLFGSKARGDSTADSDIDIMVVLDDTAKINKTPGGNTERYNLAMDILTEYDELISPMEYPMYDFKRASIPLHQNIKKEGVLFYEKQ
jgi:predicted nucleotidyltransferase